MYACATYVLEFWKTGDIYKKFVKKAIRQHYGSTFTTEKTMARIAYLKVMLVEILHIIDFHVFLDQFPQSCCSYPYFPTFFKNRIIQKV